MFLFGLALTRHEVVVFLVELALTRHKVIVFLVWRQLVEERQRVGGLPDDDL